MKHCQAQQCLTESRREVFQVGSFVRKLNLNYSSLEGYGKKLRMSVPRPALSRSTSEAFARLTNEFARGQEKLRRLPTTDSAFNVGSRGQRMRLSRTFEAGQRYTAWDLDEGNFRAYKEKKHQHSLDAFKVLSLDPLRHYRTVSLFSPFVTDMGRIKPRLETGLSRKTQRKLGKAIRRARAMGLMSFHSKPVTLAVGEELYRGDADDDLSFLLSKLAEIQVRA